MGRRQRRQRRQHTARAARAGPAARTACAARAARSGHTAVPELPPRCAERVCAECSLGGTAAATGSACDRALGGTAGPLAPGASACCACCGDGRGGCRSGSRGGGGQYRCPPAVATALVVYPTCTSEVRPALQPARCSKCGSARGAARSGMDTRRGGALPRCSATKFPSYNSAPSRTPHRFVSRSAARAAGCPDPAGSFSATAVRWN